MEIISNFLTQIVFSVGIIAIFGLLLALCRRAFCGIVGGNSTKILLATGIVGTPIHELSHALMCLVFGHKITEMKLYQLNSDDGTLGYVNHSYNPKNLYQQIGNFFIGIAPILGGSGVIFLLMYFCTPSLFGEVTSELQFVSLLSIDLLDPSTYAAFLGLFWDIVTLIFDFTNAGNILWWVFIIVSLMVASHMELSTADIKGGFKGFLFAAAGLLIADVIMYFVSSSALESVTDAMVSFSATVIGFLGVSAVFAGTMILIALGIKGISKIKIKK